MTKIVEFKMKTTVKNLIWSNDNNNNSAPNSQIINNLNFDYTSNSNFNSNNNNISSNERPEKNLEFSSNKKNNFSDFFSSEISKFKLRALLELNKEDFISELNDLLKKFREIYLYDTIKINPSKEFNFSFLENERQNLLIDNKQKLNNLPFYEDIKKLFALLSNENFSEFFQNIQKANIELEKINRNFYDEKIFNPKENEDYLFDKQSLNSPTENINANNSIKINIKEKENELDKNSNFNVNTISGRHQKFSDFNSQGFDINEIMIKLDDKIHRINSDVKLQIEDLESKLIEIEDL